MYVIIAGGGLVGKGLASKLVQLRHDVVVIEKRPEACEEVYTSCGAVTIHGNATDLGVVESAGPENCDVAVAAMRNDADNLTFALLAKHKKISQIIVRMNDPRYEEVYKSIGVGNITRTKELLIDQILMNIESPELRKVIGLGNIEICIFRIPEKGRCVGRSVAEVAGNNGFPRGVVITCVFEDCTGMFITPRGNTKLCAHDRVFLCGTRKDIKAAVKSLS